MLFILAYDFGYLPNQFLLVASITIYPLLKNNLGFAMLFACFSPKFPQTLLFLE